MNRHFVRTPTEPSTGACKRTRVAQARKAALLVALAALVLPASASAWESNLAGTLPAGGNEARAVAVDADRNVVAAGVTENFNPALPGDPDAASRDFTVAKLSGADGTQLWRAEINDPEDRNSEGFAVAVHPDGDVLAAGTVRFRVTSGRFTVVKLSAAGGAEVWRTGLDGNAGNDDAALAVAVDAAGDVLAAGFVVNTGVGDDLLVVKLAGATGTVIWSRTIDTAAGNDSGFALTANAAGDVFVAARLADQFGVVKLSGLTGAPLWTRQITGAVATSGEARAIQLTSTGAVVASGMIGDDFAAARLASADGAVDWTYTRPGTAGNLDVAYAVAVDSSDDVIAAGTTLNVGIANDFTVVKLSGTTGTELWSHQIDGGATNKDQALDVALDAADDVIVAGFLRGLVSEDFAILKFSGATGTELWRRTIDGAAGLADAAAAVAIDADGNVLAGGSLDNAGVAVDFTVVKVAGATGDDVICGDGIVSSGEDCEDGNTQDGDCCSSTCQFEAATTVCRGAAGVCDVAETCTGASATCPADAKSTAECRGSAGICDVAETCDGINDACPADAFMAATTECRGAAGVCDAAEFCTGASATCPADAKSTAECRGSAGICDVAETCDGISDACPADVFVAATTECRGAAGICDVAETCTGASATCPADAKSTAECRAAADICDVAETCDGINDACPADALAAPTTECRGAAGVCDTAEFCTGASVTCPADAKSTAECRGVAGVCDVAETCDGISDACPADAFVAATTECRGSAGVCDIAELCTGAAAACPVDGFLPITTECRGAAGVCDVADFCTGEGAACPADAKSTEQCRGAADVCDVAETCDGINDTCPADVFAAATTECRAAGGICDVAELCTGASITCPADAKSTAECRGAVGECDVAETCDGIGDACPADAFVTEGASCGAGATDCSAQDTCDGVGTCQANDFDADTLCTDDGNICTDDVCDGLGSCAHLDNTVPCDDTDACTQTDTCQSGACVGADPIACTALDDCHAVGTCEPASGTCDDPNATDGTGCDDGDACTQIDACSGGVCVGGSPVICLAGTDCIDSEICDANTGQCVGGDPKAAATVCTDDGDLCTDDTCDGAGTCVHELDPVNDPICVALAGCEAGPSTLCYEAGRAAFKIKTGSTDAKSRLSWKWQRGAAHTQAAYGAPLDTTRYLLCVYDRSAGTPELVADLELTAGAAAWENRDPKGWSYKDKGGLHDGISKVQLKPGVAGKSKAQIKAAGVRLPMPVPFSASSYFEQDPEVIVELRNSDGACWTTTFSPAQTKKNDADQFNAKAQ